MKRRSGYLTILLCMSAALSGACDPNSADAPNEPIEAREAPIYNGLALNAAVINGWSLNGWSLNGWSLNGWSLNGVALDGTLFSGTQEIDGEQVARSGLDLIGSNLILVHDDQKYILRIDDIHQDPAAPEGDVYFYDISVEDPKDGTWSSLCLDAHGDPTAAIPIANHWDAVTGDRIDDPNTVTFACRGAVLAKCVEWGYRPWATAKSCKNKKCATISLADHHQACTRMARADYCGEGLPHTINDTPIDILDRLSPTIQDEASSGAEGWGVEAEWGPDGALCIGESLRLHMLEELGQEPLPAPCLAKLEAKNCGDFSPSRDALLVNKFCEDWMADPDNCAAKGNGKLKVKAKKMKMKMKP